MSRPCRLRPTLDGRSRWYYRSYVIEQMSRHEWQAHVSGLYAAGASRILATGRTLKDVIAQLDRTVP